MKKRAAGAVAVFLAMTAVILFCVSSGTGNIKIVDRDENTDYRGLITLFKMTDDNLYFSYSQGDKWAYGRAEKKKWTKVKTFYRMPIQYDVFLQEIYEENLLIGRAGWESVRGCDYELVSVDEAGNEKVLFKRVSIGF